MKDVLSMESFLSHDMDELSMDDICKTCQVVLDSMDIIEKDERELTKKRLSEAGKGK